jgi:N-terminal half of MaoC dehydratase
VAVGVGYRFAASEFKISPIKVAEFVQALGVEPEPAYTPHVGAAVPLGFLFYVSTYGAEAIHSALEIDVSRALYGGTATEIFAGIRIGDAVTVLPYVTAVDVKRGRSGELRVVELTCDYLLEDGTVAVREHSRTIERLGR